METGKTEKKRIDAVEKKNRRAVFKRLVGYLMRHPFLLGSAIGLTIVANTLALVGPTLSGRAIDAMKGFVNMPVVLHYVLLMLVFYVLSSVLTLILQRVMIALSKKVVYRMRKDLFEKLVDLKTSYFDTHQTGDLISRITYDIDTINTSLSTDVIQIFTSIITVLGSLYMMIAISPVLVLVFAVTVPIAIIFANKMTGITKPLFRNRSAKLGELNGYVEEIVSAQSVIKAYHQEDTIVSRFEERNQSAANATKKAEYHASIIGPCMNAINNLALALVSIFGSILYVQGGITVGNISSFVLYSRKFAGPINELANISAELQSVFSAAERVFKVLDEEPEAADVPNAQVLENPKGMVDFEHLDFGYEEGKRIISDLNLHVDSGKMIAIVGKTGAGKTTIINLLMRFYDPWSGTVRIDGIDASQLTRKSHRAAFTMVLQDTWLFHGTVYDNIAYGRPNATKEEVVQVAKVAGIHEFITRLPNGYQTILDESGVNISKGQKQLLTIARALLTGADILILDEATSNVDTNTEIKIQEAIRTLMKGKTAFVIAHRLSTIKSADLILVFKDGSVVERGTHEELLELGGIYADMFNSQFS